jgi:fluoroacetyl-CoA thioesterase
MDLSKIVQPGLTHEASFMVGEKDLATHVGSGAASVLATPVMIAFMEKISHALLAKHLPEGYSSVGTLVNVRHLAPTPLGATVHVRADVLDLDGLKVILSVQAWDEIDEVTEKIGEGLHERFVINEARFLKRVEEKKLKITRGEDHTEP